jgi:hypothetical protein
VTGTLQEEEGGGGGGGREVEGGGEEEEEVMSDLGVGSGVSMTIYFIILFFHKHILRSLYN